MSSRRLLPPFYGARWCLGMLLLRSATTLMSIAPSTLALQSPLGSSQLVEMRSALLHLGSHLVQHHSDNDKEQHTFRFPIFEERKEARQGAANSAVSVDELTNVQIPLREAGKSLGAYCTTKPSTTKKVLILLHEFFGLTESICQKADGIANELKDVWVVCPDTFRGASSTFVPYCIWLALSTPEERVNNDLEDTVQWIREQLGLQAKPDEAVQLAVMGFCYGGGKALKFTTQRKPDAATVIFYGSPIVDVGRLSNLQQPVCGIYGADDLQFPIPLLTEFQEALKAADVESNFRIYENVGHAFWKDMNQIQRGDQPQTDAYNQFIGFLKEYYEKA